MHNNGYQTVHYKIDKRCTVSAIPFQFQFYDAQI